MTKRKLDKQRLSRYTSLAFPESIRVFDDEDKESNDKERDNQNDNKGINNIGESLRRNDAERVDSALAGGSSSIPVAEVTQKSNITPNYSGNNITPPDPNNNIVQPSFARPGFTPDVMGDVPNSSLPSFMQRESSAGALPPFSFDLPDLVKSQAPLLFGNVNINNIARAVLSDDTPTQAETVAKMTPEEKLLATLANTNPTPSSFWKRLLVGATKAAGRIDPNADNLGSAFGKILGGAVTRAIPAIDSASKYEENKARAIEDYNIQRGAADASLRRQRAQQEISNDQARITQEQFNRKRQITQDALLEAARLRDDKRAEAKQRLDILKDLPEDDPQRDELASELQQTYGVKASRDFGLLDKSGARDKKTSETDLRKQAEAAVIEELGATTEERARGAVQNKLDAELRKQMPPDQYAALTDPNAGQFTRAAAIKLRNEIEDRLYKVDLDYTRSDFERRVVSKMRELRGNTARTNKPVTNSKGKATNKVQASSKAQATDARTITFK